MRSESTVGFQSAFLSFILWGLIPIYWKSLGGVGVDEILAHRILWTLIFLFLIILFQRRMSEIRSFFSNKNHIIMLAVTSLLMGTNWFANIWAINNERVLESSMGFYISPMISILLGFLFLKEHIRGLMKPALLLVAAALATMIASYGKFPFIAIFLAFNFGFYGLIRKTIDVKAVPGLFVEMLALLPAAIAYLAFLNAGGSAPFDHTFSENILLIGSGVAPTVPLLLYVAGARRIRLGTMGTLQYIAPTMVFFLGIWLYKEPFDSGRLVTFVFIWAGVVLYLIQLYRDSLKSTH